MQIQAPWERGVGQFVDGVGVVGKGAGSGHVGSCCRGGGLVMLVRKEKALCAGGFVRQELQVWV